MVEYIKQENVTYFTKCIALSKDAASFEVTTSASDGEMNVVVNRNGRLIVNIKTRQEEKLVKGAVEECTKVAEIIFDWPENSEVILEE